MMIIKYTDLEAKAFCMYIVQVSFIVRLGGTSFLAWQRIPAPLLLGSP